MDFPKLKPHRHFNPLMPGGNKKTYLNKPAGLSMRDLFVTTRH